VLLSCSERCGSEDKKQIEVLESRHTHYLLLFVPLRNYYYNDVQEILNQLERSNETVRSYQTAPMGRLRISSMVGMRQMNES
jgi:hypothetical protein